MASYSTIVYVLSTLPSAVHSGFTFFYAAFQTITPSVIISLAYRIFVFYAATRIIRMQLPHIGADGDFIAANTRSGRNGVCRNLVPVNFAIAFEIAGATNGVAICPAPVG